MDQTLYKEIKIGETWLPTGMSSTCIYTNYKKRACHYNNKKLDIQASKTNIWGS